MTDPTTFEDWLATELVNTAIAKAEAGPVKKPKAVKAEDKEPDEAEKLATEKKLK